MNYKEKLMKEHPEFADKPCVYGVASCPDVWGYEPCTNCNAMESCEECWGRPIMNKGDKIKIIAEKYGYEPQSRQCIEEMAELIQAINKLYRNQNFGGNKEELAEAYAGVVEEMADVLIMIWQMEALLGISKRKLKAVIDRKLDRHIERIYDGR